MNLANIRKVYFHAHCADGMLAALLAIHALGLDATDAGPLSHGQDVAPHEGALFVDICPQTQIDAWIALGAGVIDHHASARETVARFGDRGVFGSASGAALTYEHVWSPGRDMDDADELYALVRGVSARDTWQTDSPMFEKGGYACEAIEFYGLPALVDGLWFGGWSRVLGMLDVGRFLRAAKVREAAALAVSGTRFTVGSLCGLAFNDTPATVASDVLAGESPDVDLVVGWRVEGPTLVLRLRSRDGEASIVAKAGGGGGHGNSAGCKLPVDHSASPQVQIERLVNLAFA